MSLPLHTHCYYGTADSTQFQFNAFTTEKINVKEEAEKAAVQAAKGVAILAAPYLAPVLAPGLMDNAIAMGKKMGNFLGSIVIKSKGYRKVDE